MLQRCPLRLRSSRPFRRPLGPLLGATALVASVAVHGAVAAVAALVLPRVMTSADAYPREDAIALVDVSVVPQKDPEPRSQSTSLSRAPSRVAAPPRSHAVSAKRPTLLEPRREPAVPESAVIPVVAPVVADEPGRSVVPRFALSAGTIAVRSDGTKGVAAAVGQGDPGPTDEVTAPLPENAVDVPARLATAASLLYPEAARRAQLEVELPLELVVSPQGRVRAAVALAHPGYGLEEAALSAVRSYVFHPARRAGRAVSVRMKWTVQFRLQ